MIMSHKKYSVDLNFKNNSAFILLSELFSKNNFVTMNLDFSDNFFLILSQIILI